MEAKTISIIVGIFLVGIVIAYVVWTILNKREEDFVLSKSERLQTLIKLNNSTTFKTAQEYYFFRYACSGKREFDRLSAESCLYMMIGFDRKLYGDIISAVLSNRKAYKKYLEKLKQIKSTATTEYCQSIKRPLERFLKYEERLFQKLKLEKPVCDTVITYEVTYTTPQGRYHYSKKLYYKFEELQKTYLSIDQQETTRYQIELERALMTDSLRYDILRRDNFRCQICGATAQDGVKLHVDHIMPVSKGGKTIKSNLRTLCERCNMGKSDKIE